jgi:hypothetical protein
LPHQAPSAGLLNRKPFIFFIITRTPKIVKHYFSLFEHFFGVFPFFPKNFCSCVREKAKILLSGKNRFSGSLCRKSACFLQNPEKDSEEFLQDILWNLVLTFLRFCGIIQVS